MKKTTHHLTDPVSNESVVAGLSENSHKTFWSIEALFTPMVTQQ
jgi:hypothetical protein